MFTRERAENRIEDSGIRVEKSVVKIHTATVVHGDKRVCLWQVCIMMLPALVVHAT